MDVGRCLTHRAGPALLSLNLFEVEPLNSKKTGIIATTVNKHLKLQIYIKMCVVFRCFFPMNWPRHGEAKDHLKCQGENCVPLADPFREDPRDGHPIAQSQLLKGEAFSTWENIWETCRKWAKLIGIARIRYDQLISIAWKNMEKKHPNLLLLTFTSWAEVDFEHQIATKQNHSRGSTWPSSKH